MLSIAHIDDFPTLLRKVGECALQPLYLLLALLPAFIDGIDVGGQVNGYL